MRRALLHFSWALAVGAPRAEASAGLDCGDYVPLATERAAPTARSLHGGDFVVNRCNLTGHRFFIKCLTTKPALNGFKLDDLGAGRTFFFENRKGEQGKLE